MAVGKIIFIANLAVAFSLQCTVASFENTIVQINKRSGSSKVVIDGCITPETLSTEEDIIQIIIENQNVPDLNKGSVQGVLSQFNLSVSKSNVDIIRSETFINLPKLIEIDLSENQISWIAARAFAYLQSLVKINLMRNNIESLLPRCFDNLPKLSEVNLRYNKLKSFNCEWFYATPSVSWLWLRDNRIRSVQRAAFINFPNLVELHLDNNGLETIDRDAFKGLRKLERIYFSNNKLKKFDVNFYSPSKIIFMSLHYNNLTYISESTLNDIKHSMIKVWFTANPFQCACFEKLAKWGDVNKIYTAWMCTNKDSVCVVPKTDPEVCKERPDDDFHEGFSAAFVSVSSCSPGPDY